MGNKNANMPPFTLTMRRPLNSQSVHNIRRLSMIRRWARFAIAVPPEHPLLVLYWQLFFSLYFARAKPKGQPPRENVASVCPLIYHLFSSLNFVRSPGVSLVTALWKEQAEFC